MKTTYFWDRKKWMCDAGNIKMGGWDYTFVFSWKIKTIKNKQWTWTTYIYIHQYIYTHMSNSLPMFFSNHLSIYLTYKWFTKLKVGPFVMCPFSDHHVQWCHTEVVTVVTICYYMLQVIPLPLSPSRHRRPFAQIYLPLSLSLSQFVQIYLPTYLPICQK